MENAVSSPVGPEVWDWPVQNWRCVREQGSCWSIRAAAALGSGDVQIAAANVTDAADAQAFINQAVKAWGQLDVLFSNAGLSGTNAPITDYPEDIFDNVIDVNIKGSFLALKNAIPQMSSGGSIIVTSSIMGVQARPNSVGYITSKHALVGMVRCVAREVADKNIRVNILAPGPTNNEFQATIEDRMSKMMGVDATAMLDQMIPLGRHAEPDEIARSALFLASFDECCSACRVSGFTRSRVCSIAGDEQRQQHAN